MSWFRSPLFWKTLGVYVLLSTIAIGGLLLTLTQGASSDAAADVAAVASRSAARAAIVAWLCCTVCVVLVAATVVSSIQKLRRIVQAREISEERGELLISLSERSDELGDVARSLLEIDSERQQYVRNLERQKQDLRSSATQLSAILQAMADGVIAVSQSERILFANTVACTMLNVQPATINDRRIFEIIRNTHLQDAVHEAMQNNEEVSVEFLTPRTELNISLVVSPIQDVGAVLVLHDTTEMRRLETMRRDFVSGVSHELKTPLTVIQACTDTLLEGALEDQDTARNFLQQIDEQSERLLQLILGMLQLARVESGDQVLSKEPVDLREVAEDTIRILRHIADGRDIELTLKGELELFVLGDYQALRTVAGSLVDNAIKYTPEGGHVCIELVTDEKAHMLRVIDDGIGIPQKDQVRVFERFYRVDRDRNRERGGTGLGLAIVKHLCQAMNADIELESDAGQGCMIEVRFQYDSDD